jgi:hypothetical protein
MNTIPTRHRNLQQNFLFTTATGAPFQVEYWVEQNPPVFFFLFFFCFFFILFAVENTLIERASGKGYRFYSTLIYNYLPAASETEGFRLLN